MVDFPVRYVKVPEGFLDFDVLENRFHHLMIIPIGNSAHRGATPQKIYYSIEWYMYILYIYIYTYNIYIYNYITIII